MPDQTQNTIEVAPPAKERQHHAAQRGTWRKALALAAIGAALVVALRLTPLADLVHDREALVTLFQTSDRWAGVYFIAFSTLLIMIGTPRLVFFGFGGFAFGFWAGLFWSLCGSLLGSFITFRVARWGGREWLRTRFGHYRLFTRIVEAQPGIVSVALIRVLPVSNIILNIGMALSRVGNGNFLAGSLIGFLPQGILGALIGSGLAEESAWTGLAPLGLVALVLLTRLPRLAELALNRAKPHDRPREIP
ncbi:TVP38/TMEM64 family protein [Propionivibrio limicola]|uniref:TVP38/TMEM64 family protein n=1 Tax=Propionivibrio limicola TaxID=167645 RepID=UPI0012929D3D|nr:VTT domain-containing protein [Propionivibrio limicola]